jgi:hypothetical protein
MDERNQDMTNNSVILEFVQRIPFQPFPQGSPTQFNGLFFHDCTRDERAVTACINHISISKLNNIISSKGDYSSSIKTIGLHISQ